MTPNRSAGDAGEPQYDSALVDTAQWASSMVRFAHSGPAAPRSGVVAPIDFSVEFAVNSQPDAVSVTVAGGRLAVSPSAMGDSGALTVTLRWSAGFEPAGVALGSEIDGWAVARRTSGSAEFSHPSLQRDGRIVAFPELVLIKPAAPEDADEVTVRVRGEAEHFRGASIRGWSRS